tara:strand:- start:381 stop:635 length:255 start_codon:yes stop_codon:yes gene_type:complete
MGWFTCKEKNKRKQSKQIQNKNKTFFLKRKQEETRGSRGAFSHLMSSGKKIETFLPDIVVSQAKQSKAKQRNGHYLQDGHQYPY